MTDWSLGGEGGLSEGMAVDHREGRGSEMEPNEVEMEETVLKEEQKRRKVVLKEARRSGRQLMMVAWQKRRS